MRAQDTEIAGGKEPEPVYWAVVEPNWGNPRVVPTTIRETEKEAIAAALLDPHCSLYSGAALSCVPPVPGKFENLVHHGFRVKRVHINFD